MVYKNIKALEINTVLMHQGTNLVWRRIYDLCAEQSQQKPLSACNFIDGELKCVDILHKEQI